MQPRISREIVTVERIVELYCNAHHGDSVLCTDCQELLAYARDRVRSCPHWPRKPTCRACAVHCYDEDRRARIRAVMRFAGPRLILHHPVLTLRHLFD